MTTTLNESRAMSQPEALREQISTPLTSAAVTHEQTVLLIKGDSALAIGPADRDELARALERLDGVAADA